MTTVSAGLVIGAKLPPESEVVVGLNRTLHLAGCVEHRARRHYQSLSIDDL